MNIRFWCASVKFFWGVLFLLSTQNAAAADEASVYTLKPGYDWLIDTEGDKDLQAVLFFELPWQQSTHPVVNQGYISDPLWLKYDFSTDNTTARELFLEIKSPFIDKVEVYLFDAQAKKILSHQTGGDHRAPNLHYLNHRYPLFALQIPTAGDYQLYLRVSSASAMMFNVNLVQPEAFVQKEMGSRIFYGLFFGMMLVLAFYNGIVWGFIREVAYLYNTVFVIAAALYQAGLSGLGNVYLWQGNQAINDKVLIVTTILTIYFAGRFASRFLDLKQFAPTLYKIITVIIALFILMIIPTLMLSEELMMPIVSVMELSVCLFAIAAMIWLCIKGNYWARYLLAGWSILIFGTIAFVLANLGILDRSDTIEYIHAAGLALGNVLVTSALAARLGQERAAKNKAVENALLLAQEVSDLNQEKEWMAQTVNVELERRVEQKTEELNEMLQQLKTSNKQLTKVTQTDALTGVGNRRYLDDRFPELIKQCQQHRSALGILVIDADHFKQINDEFGHLVGDECLKKLATVLRRFARRDLDVLVRYGGEEFVLLLPGVDGVNLRAVMNNLQQVLRKYMKHPGGPVTASFGVALLGHGESVESWLARADNALYTAKETGRDRIVYAEDIGQPMPEPVPTAAG